jgi:hypothetical protein
MLDLIEGLLDLDDGIVRPYLKPTPGFQNRHPDGSDVWRARAIVSAALYALNKGGMSRSEAGKWIARHKHLRPLCGKKAKGLQSAAMSWADDFKRQRVGNKEAAQVYADAIQTIHQHPITQNAAPKKFVELAERLLTSSEFLAFSRPSD